MKFKTVILLLLSVIFLISCKKYENGYQKTISIELVTEGTIHIQNPVFTATLYGVDPIVQDVPATKIVSKSFSKNSLPTTIKMEVPRNADQMIEFKNDDTKKAYYLNINWDANNNGQYDKGDIVIDFNRSFPDIDLTKSHQKIYLRHWE